jgi:hypothetical protein
MLGYDPLQFGRVSRMNCKVRVSEQVLKHTRNDGYLRLVTLYPRASMALHTAEPIVH